MPGLAGLAGPVAQGDRDRLVARMVGRFALGATDEEIRSYSDSLISAAVTTRRGQPPEGCYAVAPGLKRVWVDGTIHNWTVEQTGPVRAATELLDLCRFDEEWCGLPTIDGVFDVVRRGKIDVVLIHCRVHIVREGSVPAQESRPPRESNLAGFDPGSVGQRAGWTQVQDKII